MKNEDERIIDENIEKFLRMVEEENRELKEIMRKDKSIREKIMEARITLMNATDLVEKALEALLWIKSYVESRGFTLQPQIIKGFIESLSDELDVLYEIPNRIERFFELEEDGDA